MTLILAIILDSALFLAAWLLGRTLLRSWLRFPETLVQRAAETAVGLGLISHVVLLAVFLPLPLTGLLQILTGALVILAAVAVWFVWRARPESIRQWASNHASLLGAIGFILLCALPMSVLPTTSIDELVYHLEIPKQILRSQGTFSFTDNIYAYFPGLGEFLFVWGKGMAGEAGARLINTGFGILLLIAVFGYVQARSSTRFAGFATLLVATVPSFLVNSSVAYVDLMFGLYFLLAVLALTRFIEEQSLKWALAVGLMAGLAWATKYTGLQMTMLLVLVVLVEHLLARKKDIPWKIVPIPLISLLIVLPYLIRNGWLTGWPLFPFELPVFQLSPNINWDAERSQLFLRWLSGFGSGNEGFIQGRLLAPVLVFIKARFNEISAYDGMIGPALLLGPFLLIGTRLSRATRVIIWMAIFFTYYWAFTTQQVRFLLPAIPLLAILTSEGLARRKWFVAEFVLAGMILVNAGFGIRQVFSLDPQSYWMGRESSEEFQLSRVLGAPLYLEANRRVQEGERLYLVNMRNFGYLLDCDWRGDYIFEHFRLGQVLEKESLKELDLFFSRQQISHLMIDEEITLSNTALSPEQQQVLQRFLDTRTTLLARNSALPGQALYRLHLVGPPLGRN